MGLLSDIQSALAPNGPVNSYIGQRMQDPLFTLGMGMMSAGQPFADPGKAIQGAIGASLQQQGQKQNLAMNQMQLAMMHKQFPLLQQAMQQAGGLMGGQQPMGGLLSPQNPAAGVAPAPTSAAGSTPGAPQQSGPPGGQTDPFALLRSGMLLSAFPMTQKLGAAEMDAAKTMIANNPGLATQMAAAKSPLAVAQAQYQQALAGNDPQAVQRAFTNLRNVSGQEHVGSMSGIMTMQLPDGRWATVNPSTGLQTIINPRLLQSAPAGAQWLPGEVQAIQQRAQAEAGGESAGRAPYEMEEVQDAQGNKYLVPKSQLLAPGTPGGAKPPGASNAPALAGVGPQTASALEGRGKESQEYVATSQKAADDATTANYALDNVIQAARGASIGPGAAAREFVEKQFSVLGQSLLGNAFQPPKELGSYQELEKYGNQLGFATARTMGSREAAQIVNMAIASNPNKSLTPQAFVWIANSMKAMNNYIIAKNQAIQGADKQSPGAAQQAGSTWDARVNPQAWDLSLDPEMAAQLAPKLGADKIATALPFMSSADAVAAFRNIPASMRAAVLAKMPPAAKQELAQGLQQ